MNKEEQGAILTFYHQNTLPHPLCSFSFSLKKTFQMNSLKSLYDLYEPIDRHFQHVADAETLTHCGFESHFMAVS